MKHKIVIIFLAIIVLGGTLIMLKLFGDKSNKTEDTGTVVSVGEENAYVHISQKTAKDMIDNTSGYIILDVRTKEEYEQGHIENAILVPVDEIQADNIQQLPDREQVILVYCRSGNRSVLAAKKLAKLGYKNIYEFGGVNTWNYGLVK